MPKDRSSLSIGFNSNYSMKIRQYLLFKIKNLPLRNCIEREKPFILFWKRLRLDWGQKFEVRFLSHGDSESFVCPTLVTRRKDIFLYFFTELKPYHLSYSIFQNCLNFYLTWIFGEFMLKILWGHFVSTSSIARKTIKAILIKLLR